MRRNFVKLSLIHTWLVSFQLLKSPTTATLSAFGTHSQTCNKILMDFIQSIAQIQHILLRTKSCIFYHFNTNKHITLHIQPPTPPLPSLSPTIFPTQSHPPPHPPTEVTLTTSWSVNNNKCQSYYSTCTQPYTSHLVNHL